MYKPLFEYIPYKSNAINVLKISCIAVSNISTLALQTNINVFGSPECRNMVHNQIRTTRFCSKYSLT